MQHEPKKIALFVDFDNIYLGLRETSREAAEAFATRPAAWLRWIEAGMPLGGETKNGGEKESRVLIRRCYLNPQSFARYRGDFTRAGFSVVDCPPLTSQGKNSADIVMVMDILDALRHETRFDRFVIMSADADFTPVLQRLRSHDRRTAVLVSGQAALAYRASCDRVITEDVFIEHALEIAPQAEPRRAPPPPPAVVSAAPAPAAAAPAPPPTAAAPLQAGASAIRDPELLAAIGRRIYEEASSSGTLSASELPRILREFKEFTPTSNWLGYYSLQALAEAVLAHRNDLRITDDDPWRIAVQLGDEPAPAANGGAPAPADPEAAKYDEIRDRVVEIVSRMVAESAEPVVMGTAAHAAIRAAGPVITETRWLGKGTFKNLLLSAPSLPFTIVSTPLPGFLYDPERHPAPGERIAADGLAELPGEMVSFIRRVHQLTDAPRLPPRQYRVLFQVIAKELARAPYSLMSTGKAVRDQCVERGETIARQSVTVVLRGLGYAGYRFHSGPHRPENLAVAYRGNLLNLLRQAQVTLTDEELRMLDEWLIGPPQEPAAPAPNSARADAGRPVAPEPDYAAWAEALLAQQRGERPQPSPTTIVVQPLEPEPVAASADEPAPADAESPPASADESVPAGVEPASAAPADDSIPAAVEAASSESADEPVPAEIEPASAAPDALPADEAIRADAAESDAQPAEWQPSGEATAADAIVAAEAAPASAPEPSETDVLPSAEHADEASAVVSTPADDPHALPATEGEPEQRSDIVAGDWQVADEAAASVPVAPHAESPDADSPHAVPADAPDAPHPEVPAAEWQVADQPSASAAPAASDPPAPPAEAPSTPAEPEIVAAEWQPVDEAPAAAPGPAPSDAPADPVSSDAPSSEPVAAKWEAADDTLPAAPSDPSAPTADAPRDADQSQSEIYTPFWELAEPAPAEPSAPAVAEPSSGSEPPAEQGSLDDDDAVTPHWEAVSQADGANGTGPADAPPGHPTQMDVFPAEAAQPGDPPAPPAAPDAVPAEISSDAPENPRRDEPPAEQPGWWP